MCSRRHVVEEHKISPPEGHGHPLNQSRNMASKKETGRLAFFTTCAISFTSEKRPAHTSSRTLVHELTLSHVVKQANSKMHDNCGN